MVAEGPEGPEDHKLADISEVKGANNLLSVLIVYWARPNPCLRGADGAEGAQGA